MSLLAGRSLSRLTLRVNFSWMLAGSVVYSACQWGELVVLTKLGSPTMVGQFALGLSIVVPIMALATLKTRLVQATDAQGDYTYAHYLTLRLLTTGLAAVCLVGAVVLSDYDRDTNLVILAVMVAKAIESISDIVYGLFQQQERMDRMAKSLLLRGPLSLIALGLGVKLTGEVFWGVMAMALVWGLVLVLYDFRNAALLSREHESSVRGKGHPVTWRDGLQMNWEWRSLMSLAWLALPLGIVVALESFSANIPRYFVERELGLYFLGIFAALAYLKRAGVIVVTALGLSASSRLAVYFAGGERRAFWRLLLKLVALGAAVGLAGLLLIALFGEPLLSLMYQPEYARYGTVMLVLMAASAVDYMATSLDYGVTAARCFRRQMVLYALMVGAILVCSAYLIPLWGLMGAALAMLITSGIRATGSLVILGLAFRSSFHHPVETVGPACT